MVEFKDYYPAGEEVPQAATDLNADYIPGVKKEEIHVGIESPAVVGLGVVGVTEVAPEPEKVEEVLLPYEPKVKKAKK